jgi:DNA-binding NarL/FixJ family response regulator
MRVLNEIHAGSSVRDISLALQISESTVKNHVRNIIEKLRLFGSGSS